MTNLLLLSRVKHRQHTMRSWYSIYLFGGLIATLMALSFTDACSALVIGALAFWLTVSTFITYPAIVKSTNSIDSRGVRTAALCAGILSIWIVAGFSIIVGMLMIPSLLEALSPLGLIAGRAGATSILLFPLLGHGSLILLTEDAGYSAISRCLTEAHLPKSFDQISSLVDFCQVRDLHEEADVISKTSLALAEHGYFSAAA
jgi:hypothetical protein